MNDLWASRRAEALRGAEPLALRMRPRVLEEFAGQEHILGPGKILRRMIDADTVGSILLHGPPGTGKTTLAELIAVRTRRHFERQNAAAVGVKQIREIIDEAARRLADGRGRTILFLDEIHRFTRTQQDVLLGDVERGVISVIGATTENPLFACNAALVSRSTLLRLEPLSVGAIVGILRRALADRERGFGHRDIVAHDEALDALARLCDGDARRALTALEVAVLSAQGAKPSAPGGPGSEILNGEGSAHVFVAMDPDVHAGGQPGPADSGPASRAAGAIGAPQWRLGAKGRMGDISPAPPAPIVIDLAAAQDSIQQKAPAYDQAGDEHYDAASAMIKSVRGSDPDAALYWIARVLEAGEDPRFIARRLAILASEDIGNADPRGMMVAAACWELVERIGMPEARITLAQCATYLALAPKSNAAYAGIEAAMADAREGRTPPVPLWIKDGNVRKAADRSHTGSAAGERYSYTHTQGVPIEGFGRVGTQAYLGVGKRYYMPGEAGAERAMRDRLEQILAIRADPMAADRQTAGSDAARRTTPGGGAP